MATLDKEYSEGELKKLTFYIEQFVHYKDLDEAKTFIRQKFKEIYFNAIETDLIYRDVYGTDGPMFRQVDSKEFSIGFKGLKKHSKSTQIGFGLIIFSILLLIITSIIPIPQQLDFLRLIFFLICFLIFSFGYSLIKPFKIFLKITGVAHKVKGEQILSDIKLQFAGRCGTKSFGRGESFNKSFNKITDETIAFFGKVKDV